MTITIKIDTGNAAFEADPGECSALITNTARRITNGERSGGIMDSNGNRVGQFKVTGK